jgi:ankyrin repeat protein
MAIRILFIILFSSFFNRAFSQQPSSAPNSVSDIYFANTSLWVIGESSDKGIGVYKYSSPNWFYFGNPSAKKISALASGEPFFIDHEHNLFHYKGSKWNKIQQNVTDISGSSKSSTLWAVVNDELMAYSEDKWVIAGISKVNIKDLAVLGENNVYALNSAGSVKKLNDGKWKSFGTKKGISLSATNNSILYLSQEIINPGIPNTSKCFTSSKWIPTPISGYKITKDANQKTYYIDMFNRLFMIHNNTSIELTNSGINLSVNNNIKYNSNPNYVDTISGETAIFSAVRNNDLNSLYAFVSKGVNINTPNNKRETPLILATKLDRTQMAIKIAEISLWKPSINLQIEQFDIFSKNALWYAIENRNIDLIKTLLDRGASPRSLDFFSKIISYPSNDQKKNELIELFIKEVTIYNKHIFKSIKLNHEECFYKLIKFWEKQRKAIKDYYYKESLNSFLKKAIKVKNIGIAKYCIEIGADANLLSSYAIENNNDSLMIFCLDNGARTTTSYLKHAILKNKIEFLLLCIDKYEGSISTALSISCLENNKEIAIKLLEKGANPNVPMFDMIINKDTAFVSLLLKYDASAKRKGLINKSIENQSLAIVKILVANGADANDGIIKAIENQSLEITSFLLPLSDTTNEELIKAASSRENIKILQLLLKFGSSPQDGIWPAIKSNREKNVALLIENGADVNFDDFLLTSINNENLEICKLLLENGAEINSNAFLLAAIENKNLEICKLLLENGANASIGLRPAIEKNAAKIVRLLLIKEAFIEDNNYLVHLVISKNYTETLKALIDYNFSLDFTDDKNNTMLHFSCKKELYSICKMLIESKKIEIDAANNFGFTPLMVVVSSRNKNLDLCKLLVENGANVNAKNNNGVKVRKIAKGIKIKKYLKKNGARKY